MIYWIELLNFRIEDFLLINRFKILLFYIISFGKHDKFFNKIYIILSFSIL